MSDDASKPCGPDRSELYVTVRTDTERVVNELLTVMRNRREDATQRHMDQECSADNSDGSSATADTESDPLMDIKMSYSSGFAHALLQGAVEAFDDPETGLRLLKRIIETELFEMEQAAEFVSQATAPGSTAIN